MKAGLLITLGVVVILGAMFAFWAVGVSNSEKKLFLTGKAVQKESTVIFDNTWKTIAGEAGVLGKYKDDFKDVYVELMDARYENDKGAGQETLMKWVTEQNVTLDAGLYGRLMNTINGSRAGFTLEQQKLIDIDRQHKQMKATFPNSLIIGNRPDLEIKLVTSAKTDAAFESGQENTGINPFEKKDTTSKKI